MSSLLKLPAPALLAILSLLVVCLGTASLSLPMASAGTVTFSDAFFTATSAVTVTGLTVVETGTAYTLFGQIIIAILIQLGGMGLMTCAVFVLSSLGAQIGFAPREMLREEMGLSVLGNLFDIIRVIFKTLLVIEVIGAIVLAFVFVPEFGWAEGVWHSIFHSISATNNAGFSLFSDSFAGYINEPIVIFTLSSQFVLAGLGFAVISDVLVLRRWRRYSFHARLMLWGTFGLILLSYILYGLLEWNNPATLGGLETVGSKLTTIWFEVVTPRTAGFNIVNTSAVHDSTASLLMVLMFIGGGSTSTAGGIKVTSFCILLLWGLSLIRRSNTVHIFGYRVDGSQGRNIPALLLAALMIVASASLAIVSTHDVAILPATFEVVSALGTVGLSQGLTPDLNNFGRLVICFTMLIGRVGPLALGFYLSARVNHDGVYPEGEVYFG